MKEYFVGGILGLGLTALIIKVFNKPLNDLAWKLAEVRVENRIISKVKREAALREHILLQNEFKRIREKYNEQYQ